MAQYTGMDVAQVRALAQQMNSVAGEIQSLTQRLTGQLGNTQWTGPDQTRFMSDWTNNHQAQLTRIVQALQEASQRATQNANEQEQASAS